MVANRAEESSEREATATTSWLTVDLVFTPTTKSWEILPAPHIPQRIKDIVWPDRLDSLPRSRQIACTRVVVGVAANRAILRLERRD